MKKTIFISALFSLLMVMESAQAADCVLHVKREACPGKDSESFKKCDGKAECDEKKTASSAIECSKKALEDCANARLDITKAKMITAKYDGKDVDGGKNFCKADRADFNKCK